MITVELAPEWDVAEAQVDGIVDYLSRAQARHLVAELRGKGYSEDQVVAKLELAKDLFGWDW